MLLIYFVLSPEMMLGKIISFSIKTSQPTGNNYKNNGDLYFFVAQNCLVYNILMSKHAVAGFLGLILA